MENGIWKRHSYIMDLFNADESILDARLEFQQLNAAMEDYARHQPEKVQDLLFSYMRSFLYINTHLFTLVCQHLRMPDELADHSAAAEESTQ